MNEYGDLTKLLLSLEHFTDLYGYNPFDNYAWREVLTIKKLKSIYPSMKRVSGRSGADAECSELQLNHIELKSRSLRKRKRTDDYNLNYAKFEFDRQQDEEKRKRILIADSYVFSIFNTSKLGEPDHVVFVYESAKVQSIKSIIIEKQNEFLEHLNENRLKGKTLTRDTISLSYDEVVSYGRLI